MSKSSATALTQGAMMAAITVIFGIAGVYLPVGGALFSALAAVPVSILCMRQSLRAATLSAVAACLISMMVTGFFGGISMAFRVIPLGLIVGLSLKKRNPALVSWGWAMVAGVISIIGGLLVSLGMMGFSVEELSVQLHAMIDEAIALYEQMGIAEQLAQSGMSINDVRTMYEQMLQLMLSMLPVIILGAGIVNGSIHYFFTTTILRKLRFKIRKLPKFERWYLPVWSIYGLLFGLAIWLLDSYSPNRILHLVAVNVLWGYAMVLFVIGLAVVAAWIRLHEQGRGVKVLWVIGVTFVLMSNLSLGVSALGALDILMDFRHTHGTDSYYPKQKRSQSK